MIHRTSAAFVILISLAGSECLALEMPKLNLPGEVGEFRVPVPSEVPDVPLSKEAASPPKEAGNSALLSPAELEGLSYLLRRSGRTYINAQEESLARSLRLKSKTDRFGRVHHLGLNVVVSERMSSVQSKSGASFHIDFDRDVRVESLPDEEAVYRDNWRFSKWKTDALGNRYRTIEAAEGKHLARFPIRSIKVDPNAPETWRLFRRELEYWVGLVPVAKRLEDGTERKRVVPQAAERAEAALAAAAAAEPDVCGVPVLGCYGYAPEDIAKRLPAVREMLKRLKDASELPGAIRSLDGLVDESRVVRVKRGERYHRPNDWEVHRSEYWMKVQLAAHSLTKAGRCLENFHQWIVPGHGVPNECEEHRLGE